MHIRRLIRYVVFVLPLIGILTTTSACRNPDTDALRPTKPTAEAGVLDLTEWNPSSDDPISLTGDWEFYWDRLLSPADFAADPPPTPDAFVPVPGVWKNLSLHGEPLPERGYATYRLIVLLPKGDTRHLALRLAEMANKHTLYVNGELIVGSPESGRDAESAVPDNYPDVVPIGNPGERLEIVMMISNYHIRKGGIWHPIFLGNAENISNIRIRSLLMNMFLFGSILIMGLYHLGLYHVFRRDQSPLFFGLVCFVMACRILVTGEYPLVLLIPTISWRAVILLEYVTFYLIMSFMSLFLYSLYPKEFRKFFPQFFTSLAIISLLVVFITPIYISSHLILPMQILVLAASVYVIVMVLVAFIRERRGAGIMLSGFVVLIAAFINDVLYNHDVIHTGYLIGYGLLLFFFFQAYLLNVRLSRAFQDVEILSENLTRAEKKYRALAETAKDVILTHDKDYRITYINPAGIEITGYSEEELINTSILDFLPLDQAKQIIESRPFWISDYEETTTLQVEYINRNGRRFHMDVSDTVILENNRPAGFLVIARDITERKEIEKQLEQYRNHLEDLVMERTEELSKTNIELQREITERTQTENALRISEEKYRNLFETSRDAIYIMTKDGRYEDINTAAEEITGYSRRELLDMNAADVYADPTLSDRFKQIMDETGFIKDFDVIYRKKDGTLVHCLETSTARYAPDGAMIGYQGIIKDISVMKLMEQELRTSKIRAEEANRAKSEFLANVSHEIRTPMNGILGFTELLLEEDLTESQKESLTIIQESGETLLLLINDILDLSKIESGKMELFPEEFDPFEFLEQVLFIMRPRAMKKGVGLFLTPENLTVQTIITDTDKLRHILMNLLGNGVKFTSKGFVEATIAVETENGGARLIISIIDTGIGIPREDQDRIFEPFTQIDGSITRTYGGTGLGLTITQTLLDLLGGSLDLSSRAGEGSTFTISLPVTLPDPPAFRPPLFGRREIYGATEQTAPEYIIPAVGDARGSILLVEDNDINQQLISRLLSDENFNVTIAQNGAVALEILSVKTFDLILMDLQMPVMDGYEAIRHIRENPILSDIPIVALTAHAMKKDKKRALDAGCVGFITKPIRKDALIAEIAAHTGISQAPSYGQKTTYRESMKDIYQDFVKSLPEEMERLTQAVAHSDFRAAVRIGHDLKGLSGIFGQDALSKTGKNIESAARDEDQDSLKNLLGQLEKVIEAIVAEEENSPDREDTREEG
ncbi:MAG: PAS domain S-box protein [Deltaproteobacteria bacterium]|nr:PAS domain S-box protein [Candidatus Zymogenaceae bacterium]